MAAEAPAPSVTFAPGARVITPGGVMGTVQRVSQSLKKWPILVRLDTGTVRPYAPNELIREGAAPAPTSHQQPMP